MPAQDTSVADHWFLRQPLFLVSFELASASMLIPAIYAFALDLHSEARLFFYCGLLGILISALIAVAMSNKGSRIGPLGPLVTLFAVMLALPVALAVPLFESLRTTTFFNAYLEMVSAITTTGAPIFEDPARLSPPLHLWRAQVAWMGGFVMWVAAVAILAPRNLGGFEVTARAQPGQVDVAQNRMQSADTRTRLMRNATALFPIYAGLTGLLAILLMILGEAPLVAVCHAMAILSTSGISPIGGLHTAEVGVTGEAVMLLFLAFALSRLTFSTDTVTTSSTRSGEGLHKDPEVQMGAAIIVIVPLLLFLRHWLGAFEVAQEDSLADAARALWGGLFTVTSFLTTTGFESAYWTAARDWSGLGTPGLILMGLALIGGGVATTAGGVKLLRVYALYRHGVREIDQLIHPSSVSGARGLGRRLQRQGAFIAWIFLMIFALTIALTCLAMAATGAGFQEAITLTIAGLSNTGPLLATASNTPISLIEVSTGGKIVFCAAMVVGRLETLAIIAVFTPELWRA